MARSLLGHCWVRCPAHRGGAVAYVIGIDIGGTFTDAFVADESGTVAGTRTPPHPRTSPRDS
ncbi:hydantoinase/oxoprolinase N-terminal domain-containing protein [Modestobacter sp. DSM 44400]|uniref:hydantoinase/oxoprolinase N-terminal domain-containing protein n=1 Tax=Modestobacter sp. DSM 44400 TaxID=1550230 RepID=UPI00352AD0BC